MTVFADDATRALSKGDADFKVVLTALKLSQTPLSEDDLPPVAFCPSTIGVTLSGKGKPIANIGITCGEAPSDKNSVRVSLKSANAPELGLVINGRTLEKVAKKK